MRRRGALSSTNAFLLITTGTVAALLRTPAKWVFAQTGRGFIDNRSQDLKRLISSRGLVATAFAFNQWGRLQL
jgi:hypothetical protein